MGVAWTSRARSCAALGSLLAMCTLGLLFIPVLFSAERRAVHDRLAGTRVVIG